MPNQTKATRSHRFILSATGVAIVALVLAISSPWAHANIAGAGNHENTPAAPIKISSSHAMFATGDIDFDYVINMRMHQKMALDMSHAQLKNGKSAGLRKMVLNNIAMQKKEIAALDAWIAAHSPVKSSVMLSLK